MAETTKENEVPTVKAYRTWECECPKCGNPVCCSDIGFDKRCDNCGQRMKVDYRHKYQ